jgi:hypothetical protein
MFTLTAFLFFDQIQVYLLTLYLTCKLPTIQSNSFLMILHSSVIGDYSLILSSDKSEVYLYKYHFRYISIGPIHIYWSKGNSEIVRYTFLDFNMISIFDVDHITSTWPELCKLYTYL